MGSMQRNVNLNNKGIMKNNNFGKGVPNKRYVPGQSIKSENPKQKLLEKYLGNKK